MITAMTGFLFFILLVAAIVVGLEAQHRHARRLGLFLRSTGADRLREQHDLRARVA